MLGAVTDTRALIWYLENSPRLSPVASEVFTACDRGELIIYIPTICLVEIVYLQERGRIPADLKTQLDTELARGLSGMLLADLTAGVVQALAAILRTNVPDMLDRIIAATAIALELPLLSRDHRMPLSGATIIW
jgi:PIN domain nuclease of toxin-antitoxin system